MVPRLKVGQNILEVVTVKAWNEIAAAVDRVHQLGKLIEGLRGGTSSGGSTVLVSNDTGDDLDQYSVVRLAGLKLTSSSAPIDTQLAVERQPFSGVDVTSVGHWNKLAIFQTPVKAGDLAPAVISGVSYCLVKVIDAFHLRAYPDGPTCKTGAGPFRILYAPDPATDARPAIVLFDYSNVHYQAKATAAIAGNSSGTVRIWDGTLTNIEMTAVNESPDPVAADTLLGVQHEASKGKLYVNWELCDET